MSNGVMNHRLVIAGDMVCLASKHANVTQVVRVAKEFELKLIVKVVAKTVAISWKSGNHFQQSARDP